MGEFLSAADIVRSIDQAGNKDGTAALEDIRPHLDAGEKISLGLPDGADETANRLREALRSLNRICGSSFEYFSLPSILQCPVFDKQLLDQSAIEETQNAFALHQLERLFFHGGNAVPLVKKRFEEFKNFVAQNQIPFWKLFVFVEKYSLGNQPLEAYRLENTAADDRQVLLFRLTLYAAMWHLKYNVKAFAAEELEKYPKWFREKVKGFENFILNLLERREPKIKLGESSAETFFYSSGGEKGLFTPEVDLLPPLSKPYLEIYWHELFHCFRDFRGGVPAEIAWMDERDASLVGAIGMLKMDNFQPPDRDKLRKWVKHLLRETHRAKDGEKDSEFHVNMELPVYQFALGMAKGPSKEQWEALRNAKLLHVMGIYIIRVASVFPFHPHTLYSGNRDINMRTLKNIKEQITRMETRKYPWPAGKKNQMVSLAEMLRRLNRVSDRGGRGLNQEIVRKYEPLAREADAYILLFTAREIYSAWVWKDFKEGEKPTIGLDELPETFRLLQKHPSVTWSW